MKRDDFISGNKDGEISNFLRTKMLDLGRGDVKKILLISVKPFDENGRIPHDSIVRIADLAGRELEKLNLKDKVGCFVMPDSIDMKILDLEEDKSGSKEEKDKL